MPHFFALFLFFFLLIIEPTTVWSAETSSGYITVIDNQGHIILQTGLEMYPGDEYINEDNQLYEITYVEGSMAKAHLIGKESDVSMETLALPVQKYSQNQIPLIAVYHTHNDESYIPSDGQAVISAHGGVMGVGDVLAKHLEDLGYRVEHDKTIHEPHDANAYQRSRRTFMKLLEHNPVALFDIHRDSAPLETYYTVINGLETARILLVVGRQNQNRATTREYAEKIKAAADAKYKGLLRGIFLAHGNYNQDLNPHSILLEVGTEYNTREAAEHSVALFADIVPSFIATPKNNPPSAQSTTTSEMIEPESLQVQSPPAPARSSYTYDIAWIIGIFIAGSLLYLYLSTGNWKEAKSKLRRFRKYEFANFLVPRKKK